MKLRVQKKNGDIETITLVPPVELTLGHPEHIFNIIQDSTGMDHYFYQDSGHYDGWGMGCSGATDEQTQAIINRVESSREIERPDAI